MKIRQLNGNMRKLIYILSAVSLLLLSCSNVNPEDKKDEKPQETPDPKPELVLESPSGSVKAEILVDNTIRYRVFKNGTAITQLQPLSISLEDGRVLGRYCKLLDTKLSSVSGTIESPFYVRETVRESYRAARYIFEEGFEVEFRVYDDACAYRFRKTSDEGFTVRSEEVRFNFTDVIAMTAAPSPGSTDSDRINASTCFEGYYFTGIDQFPDRRLGMMPLYVKTSGITVCIAEADVKNYPGMFLKRGSGNILYGYHSPRVKSSQRNEYTTKVPTSWYDDIAVCQGKMDFPWRVMLLPDEDTDLLCNDIIYRLGRERQLKDISWIKPGMSTWDWETSFTLDGVSFSSGRNLQTYKYHIDYAKKMGIPYITIDAGCVSAYGKSITYAPWLKEVVDYAKFCKVDVMIWIEAAWFSDLMEVGDEASMDAALDKLSSDGIAGIKVDFFERADQDFINLQWKIAELCARNRLVLNLHSTPIPTGLNGVWPNVLSFEAVRGLEHLKYGNTDPVSGASPADQVVYDVTFPYLRGFAGPADYTPGLMRNADRSSWYANDPRPMSLGTRCRQLAAFVLYHSGIGTMADNITTYEKEAECAEFIASVPCEWDESIALDGRIGEYIIVARRRGDEWFLAGMTDWTPRNVVVDLDFLDASDWKIEIFEDSTSPQAYRKSVKEYYGEPLRVTMKSGGAFAARITK